MFFKNDRDVRAKEIEEGINQKMKKEHEREISDLKHEHKLEVEVINHNHKLELQKRDFDLKTFKDVELQKALDEMTGLRKDIAIAAKENEMLDRLVDVNSDIIDVKELINKLIGKLPEVNLRELTIHADSK